MATRGRQRARRRAAASRRVVLWRGMRQGWGDALLVLAAAATIVLVAGGHRGPAITVIVVAVLALGLAQMTARASLTERLTRTLPLLAAGGCVAWSIAQDTIAGLVALLVCAALGWLAEASLRGARRLRR